MISVKTDYVTWISFVFIFIWKKMILNEKRRNHCWNWNEWMNNDVSTSFINIKWTTKMCWRKNRSTFYDKVISVEEYLAKKWMTFVALFFDYNIVFFFRIGRMLCACLFEVGKEKKCITKIINKNNEFINIALTFSYRKRLI